MTTVPVEQTLEMIERLSREEQEAVIEIVQQRLSEQRRVQTTEIEPTGTQAIREARPEYGPLEQKREYYVVIERDEDGYYVGEVPQLAGCYSQGTTLDELLTNVQEVIQLCLEEEISIPAPEFVGIQKVAV